MTVFISACTENDIVFQAYAQAVLEPETFDNYAMTDLMPRSKDLLDCLEEVQEGLAKAYADAVEHCDTLPDQYQDVCRKTDFAMISGVLKTIPTIMDGGTSWRSTIYGNGFIRSKSLLGELYSELHRAALTVYRPVLMC
jgi:hypothetical protein